MNIEKSIDGYSGYCEYHIDGKPNICIQEGIVYPRIITMKAKTIKELKRKLAWFVWGRWHGFKINDCLLKEI